MLGAVPPLFVLFPALAGLDAVELEAAEEGDAHGDGDGTPDDAGAAPCCAGSGGEGLFTVVWGGVEGSVVVRWWRWCAGSVGYVGDYALWTSRRHLC